MKNRIFYNFSFIIFILSVSILTAQKWQGGGRGTRPAVCEVSGVVVDSESGKPIEYASVSVLQKDGSIETGGVTDPEGKFQIGEIKPGQYSIKIEFMGYTSQTLSEIELSFRGTIKKNVGEIKLKLVLLEMESVNVVEDRPVYEFETDKLIYNTSDDIISDSGTAEDVLNRVPMVTVNQEGEVSLRGNPNVKILVNGRPNRMGDNPNEVDNIPASLIDKVEVITSPSAKYDPDGMAGIINIVMRKGKYEGFNGSLKVNGKHNNYVSIGDMNGFTVYGNYKGEKWNLYSSYNLKNRMRIVDGHRRVYTKYYYINSDTTDSLYFTFNEEMVKMGHHFTLGTDYSINDQLILNGEINYNMAPNTGFDLKNTFLPAPSLRKVDEIDFDDNFNISGVFEIKKTFDNPDREFTFSLSNSSKENHEYEILQDEVQIDSTMFEVESNQIAIDVSYKHPFNEKSKVELGYGGKINTNTENMDFQITINPNFIFSGEDIFSYKRNIHGLFLEYDYKLNERFSIKPSLRYEYVSKNISSSPNSTELPNDIDSDTLDLFIQITKELRQSNYIDSYHTFYPILHFTYNITDKKNLQFGLSKRVNRPGGGRHGRGGNLRPFPRDIYSEHFLYLGNPFLKPEYSTQYDLSYNSPIPMGYAFVNVYYHQLKNVIKHYDDDRFDNKDILTFRNADSGQKYGVGFFATIMGQELGGGYNLSKLEDPKGDYELNGDYQRLTLYNRINLSEKYIKYFSFEFGFWFMKMTIPGGDLFGAKGTMWANMGISKSLFDGRMEVSLGIKNLLDRGGFQIKREKPLESPFNNDALSATEFTDVATNWGGRTIILNLVYRFGQLQEEKRKRRHMDRGDEGNMDMGY